MSHLIPIPYFRRNVGIDQPTLDASPKCGFVRYLHEKKQCDRKIIFPRRQISNTRRRYRASHDDGINDVISAELLI